VAYPPKSITTHRAKVEVALADEADAVTCNLAHQNDNPVKLITSGPEKRASKPFCVDGKIRYEERVRWWKDSNEESPDKPPFVVFGHYWRIPVASLQKDDGLFSGYSLNSKLGLGSAMCIDYSVGSRFKERSEPRTDKRFTGRLAALRWPERELVFDDEERLPLSERIT